MAHTTLPLDLNTNPALLMVLELSQKSWKLGFSFGGKERYVTVRGKSIDDVVSELEKAKAKLKAPASVPVVSCYEAGRDGFWIHRVLESKGIINLVIDASSIKVNRRKKRAKTDGLDAKDLLKGLRAYLLGVERLSVCNVPSEEVEDIRQLRRQEVAIKAARTACLNRISSLLNTQGVQLKVTDSFDRRLDKVVTPLGKPLGEFLKMSLRQEHQQIKLLDSQLAAVLEKQLETMNDGKNAIGKTGAKLFCLRGIGQTSAWAFSAELFGWRKFTNRRQVGGLVGLTPMPYSSGDMDRDQGISKAGHANLRSLAVEIGWCWLRYQPRSKLSLWFHRKFGGSGRNKRIGIVALARKLLVALWRYIDQDIVPEGAVLKSA
jgi:transposase